MNTLIDLPIDFGFLVLFLFYFCIIAGHIIGHWCKGTVRILVYWVDYFILFSVFILFVACYVIQVITFDKGFSLQATAFACYLLMFIIYLLSLDNMIINFIKSILLCSTISKMIRLFNANETVLLINELKKVNLMGPVDKKLHYVIYLVLWMFNISAIVIFCIYYILGDKSTKTLQMISTGMLIFQYLILLITMLNLIILKNFKKKLPDNTSHLDNLAVSSIVSANSSKLSFYGDFLTYKTIIDFAGCVPAVLLITLGQLNTLLVFLSFVIYFIYLTFLGCLFLVIDRVNKVAISLRVKSFYFTRLLNITLGERKNPSNANEERFNTADEEGKSTFVANANSTHSNRLNIEPLLSEIEKEDMKSMKEYLSVNFFVIFKLLYNFFKLNEKCYLFIESKMEEEGFPFRNFLRGGNMVQAHNQVSLGKDQVKNTMRSNISRISKMSLDQREKLRPNKKFELSTLMNSLEDKDYKDEFIKYHMNNDEKVKVEFCVELLFSDLLFELFPFYQIGVKDILSSIDAGNNKSIIKVLFEKKYGDKTYNQFFTKDTFLKFEIYDRNSLAFESFKSFVIEYHRYIINCLHDFNYTFLPLIIGVFRITFLDYDKIIILYRHPLAFSPFLAFNYWVNISMSDCQEKVSISTNYTEVIDVNEIEVKNNIQLEEDDYNDAKATLKRDLKFMKSLNFPLNAKLNLFVINEVKNVNSNIENNFIRPSEQENNGSTSNPPEENKNFISIIRDTNLLFRDSVVGTIQRSRKENGSDVLCALEKVLVNYVVQNRYVFKIYFTDLFKKNVSGEECNMGKSSELTLAYNAQYCKYLKIQLLKILGKSRNSFFSNKEDNSQSEEDEKN